MRFPKAAKGVSKIFAAEVMSFICFLLSAVLVVIEASVGGIENIDLSNGLSGVTLVVAICVVGVAVMMLLAALLRIIGYIQAAKDEEYFVRAIIFAIIAVVLYFAASFLQTKTGVVMEWIYTIVWAIAQLMQLLVFTSTINGLIELSYQCRRDDLVSRGSTIMKLLGTIYSLNISLIILNRFFKLFMSEDTVDTIATIVNVVILILTVIGYFLYFGYLGKASRMLKGRDRY